MIVLSMDTVTIEFNVVEKILLQKWTGFSPSETFRQAIDKTVEFIKGNPVLGILNDTTGQGAVAPVDGRYAAEAMPELFADGVKAMAIVIPQKSTTRLAVDRFQKTSSEVVENVKLFDNRQEALSWLRGITRTSR